MIRYSIHPFNRVVSGSLLNVRTRYFPLRCDTTSPASSNKLRCFVMACLVMERLCFITSRAVSSYNVSSLRSESSSRIRRRVESLSALNIASSFLSICRLYATIWLHVNQMQEAQGRFSCFLLDFTLWKQATGPSLPIGSGPSYKLDVAIGR